MSNRKRTGSTADSSSTVSSKRRKVTITTFNKQLERDHQTLSWLRCDVNKEDKMVVETLWCESCRKHEDGIKGTKTFSRAWITGSSNQKTSNIVDHATT
jgi:hypothetical protein